MRNFPGAAENGSVRTNRLHGGCRNQARVCSTGAGNERPCPVRRLAVCSLTGVETPSGRCWNARIAQRFTGNIEIVVNETGRPRRRQHGRRNRLMHKPLRSWARTGVAGWRSFRSHPGCERERERIDKKRVGPLRFGLFPHIFCQFRSMNVVSTCPSMNAE